MLRQPHNNKCHSKKMDHRREEDLKKTVSAGPNCLRNAEIRRKRRKTYMYKASDCNRQKADL